jgi:hypothetical protein
VPPRKTDRLPQRDHSDGDPQAGKQAPSVKEWTVEQWKRISPLAAMGAHFSKQSSRCLEPPSGRETLKLAKALQHNCSMTNPKRSRGRPADQKKSFGQFGHRDRMICLCIEEMMRANNLPVETVLPRAIEVYQRLGILSSRGDRTTNPHRIRRAWEALQRQRAAELPEERKADNTELIRILAGTED